MKIEANFKKRVPASTCPSPDLDSCRNGRFFTVQNLARGQGYGRISVTVDAMGKILLNTPPGKEKLP